MAQRSTAQPKVQMTLRLPPDLHDRLLDYCETHKVNQTAVVEQALTVALNHLEKQP